MLARILICAVVLIVGIAAALAFVYIALHLRDLEEIDRRNRNNHSNGKF